MKLISIANSKAIWLFATLDLNPKGSKFDGLLAAVQERYQFQIVPNVAQLAEFATKKTALRFEMGEFKSADDNYGVNLTYFADGLMVETRGGTEVADKCLIDLLQWLRDEYSTVDYELLKIRKIYGSEVYVSLDQPLSMLNPNLQRFGAAMGQKARWPNPTPDMEITGVTFGPDPKSKSDHPPIRIERDVTAPFQDGRYFTAAPLQTADHLALLQVFESALIW